MTCKHNWNDAVQFNDKRAIAICDNCGQVAFERGHAPKSPIFMADDGKQVTCKTCISIIKKTGNALERVKRHNHYTTEIKQFTILPMRQNNSE